MIKVTNATSKRFLNGMFKMTGKPNIAKVNCNIKGDPLIIQIKPESMAFTFFALVKLIKAIMEAKGREIKSVNQNIIIVLERPLEISLKI